MKRVMITLSTQTDKTPSIPLVTNNKHYLIRAKQQLITGVYQSNSYYSE